MARWAFCLLLLGIAGCNTSGGANSAADRPQPVGQYKAMTSGNTDAMLLHLDELDNQFRNTSEPSPTQAKAATAAFIQAFLGTAEAVLARDDLLPQQASKATQAAISMLASRTATDPDAYDRLIAVCDDVMKRYPETQASTNAAFAKANAIGIASGSRYDNIDKRLEALVPAIVAVIKSEPPHPLALELATRLAQQTENMGRNADALVLHRAILEKFQSDERGAESENRIRRLSQVDKPIEDFKGKDFDGKDVDLAQLKGKHVLVDFWATTCGECVTAIPHLRRMRVKYAEKGFEILGINVDPGIETARKFVERNDLDWPQIYEPANDEPTTLQNRFGVSFLPTYLVIDAEGRLIGSTNDTSAAEFLLDRLMGIESKAKPELDMTPVSRSEPPTK